MWLFPSNPEIKIEISSKLRLGTGRPCYAPAGGEIGLAVYQRAKKKVQSNAKKKVSAREGNRTPGKVLEGPYVTTTPLALVMM